MKEVKDTAVTLCYHCGDRCLEEVVGFDDKKFCCSGCKVVYEVLEENGLSSYYTYEEGPGTKRQEISHSLNKFDYLDEAEIIPKLIDFQNEKETHVSFIIPTIHCASCIWLLENLHRLDANIISGRVDFVKKEARFKYLNEGLSLKGLVVLLDKIGYEPTINLSNIHHKPKSNPNRTLIYQLAMAGFCFGNMMFFSLPEYFSEVSMLEENFRGLFVYLNLVLALPVVFYSSSDYYRSAWYAIRNGSINMDVPIVLGIAALFGYSLYEVFGLGQSGYFDSLGGLLFFLLIGKFFQQKTYENLSFDRDYTSYFPLAVTKLVGKHEEVVSLPTICVGNIIKIRKDELVPADSLLIKGDALVDYSFVTGEEVPVPVKKGEVIFAGGRQRSGTLVLAVQKAPSQGYLTDLWNHDSFKTKEENDLGALATTISGKFTLVVLLIALVSFLFWIQTDLSYAIKAFSSVLIVACPCALAMSTPFTLGNVLRVFGRQHFYLKNSQVIGRLAKADAYIFDKTGTMTKPSEASVTFIGRELTDPLRRVVKAMVADSMHPLSLRISAWLGDIQKDQLEGLEEFTGKGISAIWQPNITVRLGSAKWMGLSDAKSNDLGNRVYLSIAGQVQGYFLIQSGLRDGIVEVVNELKGKGEVHVLSGDHDHERSSLRKAFGKEVKMIFNQSPKDKLAYIKALNDKGKQTVMVGDGLNDAGALQESQVGIAVSDRTTHFSPASDVIMDAGAIGKLSQWIDLAKDSRRVIISSFILSFLYNIVGLSLAVQGLLSPVVCAILMPLSSISVVVFTTLAINFLAYRKGITKHSSWK
ncbi:heavy metal translocating P-type ATPase metal-binding domain-containing protein [Echinicola sediminis]